VKRDLGSGGWVVELRPHGVAHLFAAAGLALWLAAWLAGTVLGFGVVLALLGHWPGRSPLPSLPPGYGTVALGFMLVWLGLWTLGGISALTHFLGLLWGRDRIEFDGAGIRHTRQVGPFGRSRRHPRESVRAAALHGREAVLVIETGRETVPLSRLGSQAERARVRAEIDKALGLGQVQWFPELPEGWESEAIRGGTLLRRDRARTAHQAHVLWGITVLLAAAVAWALLGAGHEAGRWVVGSIGGLFGTATLLSALWLSWWMDELHLLPGRAERRQRLGLLARALSFVPPHLAIEHRTGQDGDDRYLLLLRGADRETCVDQSLGEPGDLIRLGRWMAGKLGTKLDLESDLRPPSQAA
jgi:hypothetical protein